MREKISIQEAIDILRKHLATILMTTFIGLGIAGILTFFVITPKYSSRAQLIVSLPQTEMASNINDINFNLQMLNTYKDIILEGDAQALEVKNRLKEESNIRMTTKEIRDSLVVKQAQDSQMFSIEATDYSSVNAQAIANITAEVFKETVKEILTNVDKITIVSSAVASSKPISPNNRRNLTIGGLLGMMLGVMLAFLLEILNRTIKSQQYITDRLGMTILGTVPKMDAKELNAAVLPANDKKINPDKK